MVGSPSRRAPLLSRLLRHELVDGAVGRDDTSHGSLRLARASVLGSLQVRLHEVLLLSMPELHGLLLAQPVLQAAPLARWNLVLRVRPADLIGPLHLLSLNHQPTNLLLAILGRCERDDEVGALLAIGLKLAVLGVYSELGG